MDVLGVTPASAIAFPNWWQYTYRLPSHHPELLGMTQTGVPTKFPDPKWDIQQVFLMGDLDLLAGMTPWIGRWEFNYTPGLEWRMDAGDNVIESRDDAAGTAVFNLKNINHRIYLHITGYNGVARTFPPAEQFYFNAYPQGTSEADKQKNVHPAYIDYYKHFEGGLLRWMEPNGINYDYSETVKLRSITALPNDDAIAWWSANYNDNYPIPVEVHIEAAQRSGTVPWYCLHMGLDNRNIVREVAAKALAALPPGMPIYIELSNEVWNPIFGQYHDTVARARIEFNAPKPASGQDPVWAVTHKMHAREVKQRLGWFKEVFDEAGQGDRCRPVLSYWALANEQFWRDMLSETRVPGNVETGVPLWQLLYGVATGAYNGHDLGDYNATANFSRADRDALDPALTPNFEITPGVTPTQEQRTAHFIKKAFEASEGPLFDEMQRHWVKYSGYIRNFLTGAGQSANRLRLMVYETAPQHTLVLGGDDTAAPTMGGPTVAYRKLARSAFFQMNQSERMGNLMAKQLDYLRDCGADVVVFQGPGGASAGSMVYGLWNITNSLTDFETMPGKKLFEYMASPPEITREPVMQGLLI